MKSNILIVGFLKELNDGVCLRLSKELNMYYANVAEMVSYELINADEMITVCGLDYYQDQEERINVFKWIRGELELPIPLLLANPAVFPILPNPANPAELPFLPWPAKLAV